MKILTNKEYEKVLGIIDSYKKNKKELEQFKQKQKENDELISNYLEENMKLKEENRQLRLIKEALIEEIIVVDGGGEPKGYIFGDDECKIIW